MEASREAGSEGSKNEEKQAGRKAGNGGSRQGREAGSEEDRQGGKHAMSEAAGRDGLGGKIWPSEFRPLNEPKMDLAGSW